MELCRVTAVYHFLFPLQNYLEVWTGTSTLATFASRVFGILFYWDSNSLLPCIWLIQEEVSCEPIENKAGKRCSNQVRKLRSWLVFLPGIGAFHRANGTTIWAIDQECRYKMIQTKEKRNNERYYSTAPQAWSGTQYSKMVLVLTVQSKKAGVTSWTAWWFVAGKSGGNWKSSQRGQHLQLEHDRNVISETDWCPKSRTIKFSWEDNGAGRDEKSQSGDIKRGQSHQCEIKVAVMLRTVAFYVFAAMLQQVGFNHLDTSVFVCCTYTQRTTTRMWLLVWCVESGVWRRVRCMDCLKPTWMIHVWQLQAVEEEAEANLAVEEIENPQDIAMDCRQTNILPQLLCDWPFAKINSKGFGSRNGGTTRSVKSQCKQLSWLVIVQLAVWVVISNHSMSIDPGGPSTLRFWG